MSEPAVTADQFTRGLPAAVSGVRAPKIEVLGFNFYYDNGNHALKDININIPEGTTTFIGPSGCGKSTLLRAFARMFELYPGNRYSGDILIDGKSIFGKEVTAHRADTVMIFQQAAPFPMTIFENIAFGLKLWSNLSKSELADRVEDSLKRAALWPEVQNRLDRSALGLSGGQQQRLCIARAISLNPKVLLCDEITAALDPIATGQIEDLLDDLRLNGQSIVAVTHNMQQAARMGAEKDGLTALFFEGEIVNQVRRSKYFKRRVRREPRIT